MFVPSVFFSATIVPPALTRMRSSRTRGDSLSPHWMFDPPILLEDVHGPVDLAARRIEHAQVPARAERVDAVALDGGSRARAIAAIIAEAGAVCRFPQPLAARRIEGDHVFGAAAGTERIQPASRGGKRRIALAGAGGLPCERGPAGRPGLQQTRSQPTDRRGSDLATVASRRQRGSRRRRAGPQAGASVTKATDGLFRKLFISKVLPAF